jgi:hypothetical protein
MGRLNQPARQGYAYRSPGQTNAQDLFPNLREDVVASQRADNERMRRGLSTNESPAQTESRRNSPHGNISQKDAAGRAMLRSGSRAGLVDAAAGAGYQFGRALDEETGVGKKMVDESGLGALAKRLAKPKDKVELTEDAKSRIDEEDIKRMKREVKAEKAAERAQQKDQEVFDEGKAYKRGGTVSSRADGIALRGKTRGKVC